MLFRIRKPVASFTLSVTGPGHVGLCRILGARHLLFSCERDASKKEASSASRHEPMPGVRWGWGYGELAVSSVWWQALKSFWLPGPPPPKTWNPGAGARFSLKPTFFTNFYNGRSGSSMSLDNPTRSRKIGGGLEFNFWVHYHYF